MRRLDPLRLAAILAFLWLSIMNLAGDALAQASPGAGGTAAGSNGPPPAALRLAQVVPRLPAIYYYAVAQDEAGSPIPLRPSDVSALVGSERLPVNPQTEADPIAIVFLVDISASLGPSQAGLIRKSLRDWIGSLRAARSKRDSLSLEWAIRSSLH